MKVRVGDKVKIISGADKGKEGKIIKTFKETNKVVVEGLNLRKKHIKPNGAGEGGGIVDREARIDASNVKVVTPVDKKTVKKEKPEVKKETKKSAPKKEKKDK
ncbi:MAG TPA: 50S ribosomal protein L24 [Bacilli bacterium]|nr:50S ribosomal protein L24 [Bacilli bacterium]